MCSGALFLCIEIMSLVSISLNNHGNTSKGLCLKLNARSRVNHINRSRTFHNFIPEIDQGILKEIFHKLRNHEKNVYRCLGSGATWDQKQLHEVSTNEASDKCAHCGVKVESIEHVLRECNVINSHRKCREMFSFFIKSCPFVFKWGCLLPCMRCLINRIGVCECSLK